MKPNVIVSYADWLPGRKALLEKEKELSRLRDEISAERRALRLLALHEVALAIGGQSDPAQTLELILDQACSLLQAPAGSIYLWDEVSGKLHCTLAPNTPEGMLGGSVLPGEGSAGKAFGDCKTVLINNYREWSGASPMGRDVGVEAAVSVPLRMGDRLLLEPISITAP